MSSLQEGLAGVRVVQSFGQETDHYASYRARSRAQVSAWRRISLVNIGFFPAIAFAQSLALASVLVAGGYLERHGRVTVGTIVAFALYLISLFDPIARLGDWFSEFQSGRAALAKIATLLEEPVTVPGGTATLPESGPLVVEDVTFAYGDSAPAVTGVSLRIEPGEQLALVGATGAGKSTLAKLLVRAYDPNDGQVTFGGVDLRDRTARRAAAPDHVRPAGRASLLGHDRRERPARPSRRERRARRATRCGGSAPSSASRRCRAGSRPMCARAACASRAASASSSRWRGSRSPIRRWSCSTRRPPRSIRRPRPRSSKRSRCSSQNRTMITIAHRLSTAERADRVALMEASRLVEVASHDELVAQGDRYARLWASWQAGLVA